MRVVSAIGNTVLLKEVIVEETTNNGLIISSKSQTPIYEIISMGDIAKEQALFSVGDKVMIKHTIGSNVYVDTATVYKSVKWWEIDAIINN